jgi:hypothetical protein
MEAVVKYAYGTAELNKRASDDEKSSDDNILASIFSTDDDEDDIEEEEEKGKNNKDKDKDEECEDCGESEDKDIEEECDCNQDKDSGAFSDFLSNVGAFTDTSDAKLSLKSPNGTTQELGEVEVTAGGKLELSTKEGRAQARIKLAEKGLLGFNEMSADAHPGGSRSAVDAGNLDVTPKTPAAFHVSKDIKEEMLELANMPPRVRKQAEMIQSLVSEGRMKATDVDQLVSHGVDADAVKYWKGLYGNGDAQSKDFSSKLISEHAEAKKAEEIEAYKGRVKRAYELANQMVIKGMISEAQIDSQVNDIMKWNDAGFNSFKDILSRQPSMSKQASIPMVGLLSSEEVMLPERIAKQAGKESQDVKSYFDTYFDSKGLKF